jgi:hypothetical protein
MSTLAPFSLRQVPSRPSAGQAFTPGIHFFPAQTRLPAAPWERPYSVHAFSFSRKQAPGSPSFEHPTTAANKTTKGRIATTIPLSPHRHRRSPDSMRSRKCPSFRVPTAGTIDGLSPLMDPFELDGWEPQQPDEEDERPEPSKHIWFSFGSWFERPTDDEFVLA